MFDYIALAFFAAFLGLKYAQTKATGHLWFLLPLLLVVGLDQGWANHFGKTFFVFYRLMLLASCALAAYMYYRDYHKRNADAIKENTKKRRVQEEKLAVRKAAESKNSTEKQTVSGKNRKKK